MPSLKNMARAAAAQGLAGMSSGDTDMLPTSPEEEGPEIPIEGGEAEKIEGYLQDIESCIEGVKPDVAEQIRTHIQAIRDLSASIEESEPEAPPTPEESAQSSPVGMPQPPSGQAAG